MPASETAWDGIARMAVWASVEFVPEPYQGFRDITKVTASSIMGNTMVGHIRSDY